MEELLALLKIEPSPLTDGLEFVKIICGVDFEPHGNASETWEIYWTLTLPQIPYYWHSLNGWRRGQSSSAMSFSGRTFDAVVSQAVSFMKQMQKTRNEMTS